MSLTGPIIVGIVGLGVLGMLGGGGGRRSSSPRSTMSLRDRAIEAQRIAANVSKIARDLAARATKAGE